MAITKLLANESHSTLWVLIPLYGAPTSPSIPPKATTTSTTLTHEETGKTMKAEPYSPSVVLQISVVYFYLLSVSSVFCGYLYQFCTSAFHSPVFSMFSAGYPLISYFTTHPLTTLGAYNLGGINGSGQVPNMPGNWGLIDADTPEDALTKISYTDGEEWKLVFSDEFNLDGRSFFPGDDPYWEAVDLHYWGTNNLEWYSPGEPALCSLDRFRLITCVFRGYNDQRWQHGHHPRGKG